jgi:predicted ATPase/DNA-binding XRE family transcriptional regulator
MPDRRSNTVEPFGALLRRMRERVGLTQQELAEAAGLTPQAVSALERGTRTRPYPHTVRSLAQALGASETERDALVRAVPRRGTAAAPGPDESTASAPPAQPEPRSLVFLVPPTPLYGRDQDIATVTELIRSGAARLVTLTGPGGVGKTRLAAALSDHLANDYPDGVVRISLAALADATDIAGTIGRALGVVGSDGPAALDAIAAHLGTRRVLLVLDNFEHLLSAAPQIAGLTSLCPNLTVLVSSRSPLRVRGEREYVVEPLPLPAADAATPDELATAPAGALVLDRALAMAPRLEMTEDEIRALAQLCHRLSGLPLAIELASPHLRMLTPHMLLERLDDIASASGERDLPPRQRSMRATLDWSFGLLNPAEQAFFRFLAIFRGGATLEDIEKVANAAADLSSDTVLALLGRLIEQSLVVVRRGVDGRQRYDLLEPVAQYARSLLVGEEARRASAAHARFFRDLAENAAVEYEKAAQLAWLSRTEAEHANLLVAIDRSLDASDADTASRITWSLWLYWWLRGQATVGRRRAEQCLAARPARHLNIRMRLVVAAMSYVGGDWAASSTYWTDGLRMALEENDPEIVGKAYAGVGLAALAAGDMETAEQRFREALDVGLEAGESGIWLRSLVHVWLGTVLLLRAENAAAVEQTEHGLELARRRGDRLSNYMALYTLAQAAIDAGELSRARRYIEEGLNLSEQTRDMANVAYFLDALAVVESADERAHRVGTLLGAARSLRETVGANVYAYYQPDESRRSKAEDDARVLLGDHAYDEAVRAGRGLDAPDIIRFALNSPG